jgi:hypothetical protein
MTLAPKLFLHGYGFGSKPSKTFFFHGLVLLPIPTKQCQLRFGSQNLTLNPQFLHVKLDNLRTLQQKDVYGFLFL